ncbi:phosphoadenosine phosphosulfate reductase domain-containing protein [Lysinibacillus fusiformis]|uniref:phosphoadenosine phosphosulfate reductase domain-containing protein n=1 Tax=Lysinibacillus fusiformis TaxID=28031 RepID=UPI00187F8324|nr:phosphoadenosine phosphosulfate reductase family protein [Lysinibacillus fusiformis]MBD8523738.1 phosphoadenosine phosphosulfate reductase family protein [Lysinibacillus fusiformis]
MQLTFNCEVGFEKTTPNQKPSINLLPLSEYDHVIISESGGKDSMACLFYLLDLGVPKEKIELWHQCVDGKGIDHVELMDWPVTESYIESVGKLFGIKTFYQWRSGGIYNELMRKDSLTGDVYYTTEAGEVIHLPTRNGKKNTRMKWPAMSPDLRIRWCSPYVKIDVFRRVLNNHPTYKNKKILVVTGERREESSNRAKYAEAEIHTCSNKSRLVHAWRPVIDWTEQQIWDSYEKRLFLPHPAYLLGWNRTSCFGCIFSTADLWAMMREIAPERFNQLVRLEQELNHTIDTSRLNLNDKANLGSLDRLPKDFRVSKWVQMALTKNFSVTDLVMDKWEVPAGAFRGNVGGPV